MADRIDRVTALPPREARAWLEALPGVGPWTAGYVAMRALGDPDVFLAEDTSLDPGTRHSGPSEPFAPTKLAARLHPKAHGGEWGDHGVSSA
jgi:AraC family transcriptional regulator of adaptative response / DNA-3-methyladenine glycosylase II